VTSLWFEAYRSFIDAMRWFPGSGAIIIDPMWTEPDDWFLLAPQVSEVER
jgi:hypothetical protein